MKKFFTKTVAALLLSIASVDASVEAMSEVSFIGGWEIPAAPCFFPYGEPYLYKHGAVAFKGKPTETARAFLTKQGVAVADDFYFTVQVDVRRPGFELLFHPHAAYLSGEDWNNGGPGRAGIRTTVKALGGEKKEYNGRYLAHDDGLLSPPRNGNNPDLAYLGSGGATKLVSYHVDAQGAERWSRGRGAQYGRKICGIALVVGKPGTIHKDSDEYRAIQEAGLEWELQRAVEIQRERLPEKELKLPIQID
jgi:hypothetical protein